MEQDQLLTTDSLPVLASMPDNTVDTVISDIPYPNGQGLFNDTLIDGIAGLYLCTKKAKNYVVFFWTPNVEAPRPPPGWYRVATHIWHKPDARSITPYELIIVWSKNYRRHQSKVWTIPILDYRTLKDFGTHPTQKPLRLMTNLVNLYTKEGEIVLDPFAGTGTTGVAAQQLKRHYIIIEKKNEYATFAQQRLQPTTTSSNTTTTTSMPIPAADTQVTTKQKAKR